MLPAGPGPGVGQRLRVGDPFRPAHEAPGLGEGPRGHVVGPAGQLAQLDRPLEQPEKPGLDRDRRQVGRRVQPADLRLIVVDRQLRLELVDEIEARLARSTAPGTRAPRRISKNEPMAGRWTRSRSVAPCDSDAPAAPRRLRGGRHLGSEPPQPQEVAATDAGAWRSHTGPRRKRCGRECLDHARKMRASRDGRAPGFPGRLLNHYTWPAWRRKQGSWDCNSASGGPSGRKATSVT